MHVFRVIMILSEGTRKPSKIKPAGMVTLRKSLSNNLSGKL